MIHVIYANRLVQRRHFLASGVYAIYTACASIGQWLPLVYIAIGKSYVATSNMAYTTCLQVQGDVYSFIMYNNFIIHLNNY